MASNPYRETLKKLLKGNTVAYYADFARLTGGVKSAVMLSQLLYWSQIKNGDWIWKRIDDFERETGLSKYEQQSARADLVSRGFIKAELRGVPPVWWYQVDIDNVVDLINQASYQEDFPSEDFPPKENPSDEDSSQRREEYPPNVGRIFLPTIGGNSTRLNKELKTTSIRLPENTSTIVEEDQSQDGEEETFEDLLRSIGVFEECIKEIIESDWTDDQLWQLYSEVISDQRVENKGAVFIHRFRKNKPPMTEEEKRHAMYAKYAR